MRIGKEHGLSISGWAPVCFTTFGGMGGCPFIKGDSGNISTEDLVFMLHQMGIETGIDVGKISAVSRSLKEFFDKRFSGKMHRLVGRDDLKIISECS